MEGQTQTDELHQKRKTISMIAYGGVCHEQPNTSLAYSVVFQLGSGVAQIGRHVCKQCDENRQTPLRAVLRSYETALRFAHEVVISRFDNTPLSRPLSLVLHSQSRYLAYLGPIECHFRHRINGTKNSVTIRLSCL